MSLQDASVATSESLQLKFDFLPDLPLVVQPAEGQISSDAGLLAIRQADERWAYTHRMAACLSDERRQPDHAVIEMLRQRLYGVLADYEDCNDHDTLRDDPVFKLLAGRTPDADPLASQPTLSRFENAVSIPALYRLLDFLCDTGVQRLCDKHGGGLPSQVTLDIDATDDPTHGQQQLTLFHAHYGQYQYFPLIISEPTTQHIFLAWLRPGTIHASKGADDDLRRVARALRAARPDIAIHVRGDAGCGVPWMYEVCEAEHYTYTFGLASNPRLVALAQPLLERAIENHKKTGQKQRLFTAFEYQAETWDRARTVIAKAECQDAGTNLRFVITNLPIAALAPHPSGADAPCTPDAPGVDAPHAAASCASDEVAQRLREAAAQRIYDDYVQRGTSEHRMDELKNGLHGDRLSCHRFLANFWRLLLHAAALNLLNAVRDDQTIPAELRTAQPQTWRSKIIKVAATIVQSTRRIVVALAAQWPHWPLLHAVGHRSLALPRAP